MRITLLGSGNVATHMAAALKNAGHRIIEVYSRNIKHASLLAYHVGAEAVDDLSRINADADLYIISIKDDAITDVAAAISHLNKLIVHTSGATSLQALAEVTSLAGVFYPLQTFSKQKEVDFKTVPMCIEGADETITALLTELARTISNSVHLVSSHQRKILHVAAVFACNFPNYLYAIAQQLLAKNYLPFDLLRPLIIETADKVRDNLPASVQTGPAIRNDQETMDAHLQLLADDKFLQKLYQILSDGIMKVDKNQP